MEETEELPKQSFRGKPRNLERQGWKTAFLPASSQITSTDSAQTLRPADAGVGMTGGFSSSVHQFFSSSSPYLGVLPDVILLDEPLATLLNRHVEFLAAEIGERNVFIPGTLEATANYIARQWEKLGLMVKRQPYRVHGTVCENLETTVAGSVATPMLLVGAHYDSVLGSPGANDNGSGIAVLLELSRLFAEEPAHLPIRFVAFVNEEPPFFPGSSMGSAVYAREAKRRGDQIEIMICLETIGCFSDKPGSQKYPPFFKHFFPNRGDFIAFVTKLRYRGALKRMVQSFRAASEFPIESVATFASVPGIDWSDHKWFWRYGYPAVMITDTAPYRYPYYHSSLDTADKVNYAEMARLTKGLGGMLRELASDER